jgi:hypothetical protein
LSDEYDTAENLLMESTDEELGKMLAKSRSKDRTPKLWGRRKPENRFCQRL